MSHSSGGRGWDEDVCFGCLKTRELGSLWGLKGGI